MYVKEISWIDKGIHEANFIVSDGDNDVLCFAQPFFLQVGDTVNALHSIDAQDVVRSENRPGTELKNEYKIIFGKLKNQNYRLVQIGQLFIIIDDDCIPKDIVEGNYISLMTSRLRLF